MMVGTEAQFREKLVRALEATSYRHRVYYHEGDYARKFSVHRTRAFVDLYVQTGPDWPHHDKFPVIGIETKLPTRMGWLVEAINQVGKYSRLREEAVYSIDGKEVRAPELFLVATVDSVYHGYVYRWEMPEARGDETMLKGAWAAMTVLYERLLLKNGAALLRRDSFYTNMHGNSGAVTHYRLGGD